MLRFFLFVISMMAASASMAEDTSPCSAATAIPKSSAVPGSMSDLAHRRAFEAAGPYASFGKLHVHFGHFVATVTEHLAARLAKENLCLDNPESKERSLLQFVNWPVVAWLDSTPRPLSVAPLDAPPSSGCRLSSPWLDLAFERKPVPWIRGIVRWNARQSLADQAVLDGVQDVPPGVAIPMELREYHRLSDEYRYRDLLARRVSIAHELRDPEILSDSAAKPFEERIPPDILWLFRRVQPTSLAGFGDGRVAIEKGAEGYTKLVIALIDRCLASDGADIHYNSIMDVADPALLEQYKIDMP